MAGVAAPASRMQPPITQLIVKFKPLTRVLPTDSDSDVYAMTNQRMAAVSAAAGVSLAYRRPMSGNAHVLKLAQPVSAAEAAAIAARISRQADVAYAEPDRWMFPATVPNDAGYANQWHYKDPEAPGYAGAANLPGAWDITTGSRDVVVAVIDTGVVNHSDLQGNLIGGSAASSGYDMISYSSTAYSGAKGSNDGDGRDGDPTDPGDFTVADTCYAGSLARDSSWHGTHVAGTIGAVGNNGAGVTGVAWDVSLQTVRVLGSCGGSSSDVVDAIYWAAGVDDELPEGVPANASPAQVINMSLGGSGACDVFTQNAINAAVARGTTVVVAAGNAFSWVGNYSPASCANVVTVGALGPTGAAASYSNYDFGSSYIALSAPGGEQSYAGDANGVYSTLDGGTTTAANDDGYQFYQGTSMATPHVSGIVALMLAANSKLTDGTIPAAEVPALIKAKLQATVRPFPTGTWFDCETQYCGAGMVDAASAVRAVSTAPDADAGNPQNVAPGATVNLSATGSTDDGAISSYAWTQTAGVAATLTGANTSTPSFVTPVDARIMTFRVTVTDDVALSDTDQVTITAIPPAPSALAATPNGATSIDLTWTDNSSNEAGFKVERSVAGANVYTQVAAQPANAVSFSDTTVAASTSYDYRVRAYYDAVNSSYSGVATATTTAAPAAPSSGGGGGGGGLGWLALTLLAVPLVIRRTA